jgi:hypothetical protein
MRHVTFTRISFAVFRSFHLAYQIILTWVLRMRRRSLGDFVVSLPRRGHLHRTCTDRECCVVSTTNPYGRILGFLVRSRYFLFQVATQFCSRG